MLNLEKELFIDGMDDILCSKIHNISTTILLVDDEINNLQLLKRTFHRKYNVLTAENGLEALKIFEENIDKISLIVSDHKMPVMDGTEFLEKVNEIAPDVIKILLTGFADVEILTDAVNKCNLLHYMLKPFEPEELTNIVELGINKFNLTSSKAVIFLKLFLAR